MSGDPIGLISRLAQIALAFASGVCAQASYGAAWEHNLSKEILLAALSVLGVVLAIGGAVSVETRGAKQ